jgi:hypothetical protein
MDTSYQSQVSGGSAGLPDESTKGEYWALSKLKKAYQDYLFSKRAEIDEQINSRRYYHGSQYTEDQIRILNNRKQPILTDNRIQRKIDGVTGLIERLRQDPKAYPRTPMHAQGAELATQCIRYVLDEQRWKAKSPYTAKTGAIDGIGGIKIELETGDKGDREISFDIVEIEGFFYNPHCYRADFSDSNYMGEAKWLDREDARELWPDAPESAFTYSNEFTSSSDRDTRWFSTEGSTRQVRIVDIWYKHKGKWCWAQFTGNAVLDEGEGYLTDNKKRSCCKYIMYSANVDQDGDRYGFVRNLKSLQDGVNAKQSKMQHIMASKRIIVSAAAGGDIEKIRAEYARADGVIQTAGNVNENIKLDDQSFDFMGLGKLLELNLNSIENFGPNPALIGQGVETKSGRAIALLQQAGMAELGPFILAYRGWKERVYRGIWNAVQQHWTQERYIRVSDDEDLMQHLEINKVEQGPDGRMVIINYVGALDVDIVLDEGPDNVTMAQDTYDTLISLAQSGTQVPPDILIELSPNIDSRTKKVLRQRLEQAAQQPPPELQIKQAEIQAKEKEAEMGLQVKQQEGQQKLELEKQLGLLGVETERMKLGMELEHEQQKMGLDGQKKSMECDHEERKLNLQVAAEREKAYLAHGLKKEELDLKDKHAEKEHDLKVKEIRADKDSVDGLTKAIEDLKSKVDQMLSKNKA